MADQTVRLRSSDDGKTLLIEGTGEGLHLLYGMIQFILQAHDQKTLEAVNASTGVVIKLEKLPSEPPAPTIVR